MNIKLKPDSFGIATRRWAKKNVANPIRTLSLFSGAGGLDIGFHDVGFDIQTMIEADERFIETLSVNCGAKRYFGDSKPKCVDIRSYRTSKNMQIDFIIGGPPCQPFSAAGRRAAGSPGSMDKRGDLFKQYVRIVKRLSPKGFLFENVYGLIGSEKGKIWRQIKSAFEKAGYNIFFRILDAADYGVPQHRKRLFIVGVKGKTYNFPRPTHGPFSPHNLPYFTAEQALEGTNLTRAEKQTGVNGRYGKLLNDIPPGLNYAFYTEKMGHPKPVFAWRSKFYDFLYKADPKAPIRTLKAQGGQYTGPFHWRNRRFAVAELKRLQTFPDIYQILGGRTTAIEQIGNSVPPQLARILALTILNQVFNVDLPVDLPLFQDNQSIGSKRSVVLSYKRKAEIAIGKITRKPASKTFRRRSYKALLSKDFGWAFPSKHENALYVEFIPKEIEWKFVLSFTPKDNEEKFSIVVTPTSQPFLNSKIQRIVLVGSEMHPKLFTGAWKALELELARKELKADLVQLCGYYQYLPAFRCEINFETNNKHKKWKILQLVTAGIGVREIIPAEELSRLWGVSESRVLHYAMGLRELGYDIRNENTNPQIPQKHFLIPYTFPTLHPLSVQMRKSLEKVFLHSEK